jgi:hypothetical protein
MDTPDKDTPQQTFKDFLLFHCGGVSAILLFLAVLFFMDAIRAFFRALPPILAVPVNLLWILILIPTFVMAGWWASSCAADALCWLGRMLGNCLDHFWPGITALIKEITLGVLAVLFAVFLVVGFAMYLFDIGGMRTSRSGGYDEEEGCIVTYRGQCP